MVRAALSVRKGLRRSGIGTLLLVFTACAACSGSSGFPAGAASATVTWHQVPDSSIGVPQPFSGTVAGQSVTGTALIPRPTSFTNFILGEWTGTFEGKTFHLTVSASFPNGLGSASSDSTLTVKIAGTYGSWRVSGTATEVGNSNNATFTASIGPHHVSGTLAPVNEGQSTATASAHFTVSS